MITVINKDNSKWRLIYNDSVLLLDMTNQLTFDVIDEKTSYKTKIVFIFSDEGEKLKANQNISEDGHTLTVKLHQWNSSAAYGHIENIEPLKINTRRGSKIWIKFRTQTYEKNNWRNFDLTVWIEEN